MREISKALERLMQAVYIKCSFVSEQFILSCSEPKFPFVLRSWVTTFYGENPKVPQVQHSSISLFLLCEPVVLHQHT